MSEADPAIVTSWLERTRALGPMIDAEAAANEHATELSPKVVEAMDAAGLFAILAPRELGGGEVHPLDAIDVVSELSYWDGSAGWYGHAVMVGGSVAGAFLGPKAAEAIFPDGRYAHAAGQAAPTGKAVRDGDGYRVSGQYSFASGSPHAQFLVGGFMVEGREPPTMLIGLVPRENVEFLGNWDVLGLRGTGSYDFAVPECWVHGDFFFNPAAPEQQRGGALYRMGFMAHPQMCHAAFALGATRRVLDEWLAYARGKVRGEGALADQQSFQRDFAMATGELRAADAYLRQTFAGLYAAAEAGEPTPEQILEGQVATSHAFTMAKRVAQTAFNAATTAALRNGNALQRAYRDVMAGSAHVINSDQALLDLGAALAKSG
ncbi:MAG: acyl-CoA dehydrogenase family protein [Sphingomonadaceae bacterium]